MIKKFLFISCLTLAFICIFASCDKKEEPSHEHVYGEWVVTKKATAEEKGIQTCICDGCGDVKTEETPSIYDLMRKSANEDALTQLCEKHKNGLANRDSFGFRSADGDIFYDDGKEKYYLHIYMKYSYQNSTGGYDIRDTWGMYYWDVSNNQWYGYYGSDDVKMKWKLEDGEYERLTWLDLYYTTQED